MSFEIPGGGGGGGGGGRRLRSPYIFVAGWGRAESDGGAYPLGAARPAEPAGNHGRVAHGRRIFLGEASSPMIGVLAVGK